MKTDPAMIAQILRERGAAFTKSAADDCGPDTETKTTPASIKKDTEAAPGKQQFPEDGTLKKTDPIQALDTLNPKGTPNAGKKNPELSKVAATLARLRELNAQRGTPSTGDVQSTEVNKQANTPAQLFSLSQESLAKMASTILSTEEGVVFANEMLEKSAGEEAAREMIREAYAATQNIAYLEKQAHEQDYLHKQAAEQNFMQKQAAVNEVSAVAISTAQALDSAGITEGDSDDIIKMAAYHADALENDPYLAHPMCKAAYAQGMDDAAAVQDAMLADEVPELPLGGDEVTPDKIAAVLEELVGSGELDEEAAMQILASLEGDEGLPEEEALAPAEAV